MRFPRIRYLDWAKNRFDAHPPAFNLAASGMESPPPEELAFLHDPPLPVLGVSPSGHPKLTAAIAARLGVPASHVTAAGTSGANFLAQAVVVEPGDEVLVEWPAYEPLWRTLGTLGARVRWLPREAENGFVPDVATVAAAFAQGVKLCVLSDLHNPSATLLPRETVRELARLAARHDAWLMVDEVYLAGVFEDDVESAARLGERVIVTGSLTKTYGFSALRAGWMVAPPELVRRGREVFDHIGAGSSFLADEASARVFARLDHFRARAAARRAQNWPLVQAFAAAHGLELAPAAGAFIAWAKLPAGIDSDAFVDHLVATEETLVVPGAFFGAADRIRLGFGLPGEHVAEGLRRLGRALATFPH
jgi:aspartate/methionine/tyrosine aminotransferase